MSEATRPLPTTTDPVKEEAVAPFMPPTTDPVREAEAALRAITDSLIALERFIENTRADIAATPSIPGLSPSARDELPIALERFIEQTRAGIAVFFDKKPSRRPSASDDAEVAISADIDAIVKRLDEGIPRLNTRLDELLERQRRPLTV
jgi:hypothetical protein